MTERYAVGFPCDKPDAETPPWPCPICGHASQPDDFAESWYAHWSLSHCPHCDALGPPMRQGEYGFSAWNEWAEECTPIALPADNPLDCTQVVPVADGYVVLVRQDNGPPYVLGYIWGDDERARQYARCLASALEAAIHYMELDTATKWWRTPGLDLHRIMGSVGTKHRQTPSVTYWREDERIESANGILKAKMKQ